MTVEFIGLATAGELMNDLLHPALSLPATHFRNEYAIEAW